MIILENEASLRGEGCTCPPENSQHWEVAEQQIILSKNCGDGKRWPLTPFPFLAPWPSRPPAIKTPTRSVPAGPLKSWPKNASCSGIPPQTSCTCLSPRRWATTRCRLPLRPCTAPLSCSLQPLLKLSRLSLRHSLLHSDNLPQSFRFCWIKKIQSLKLCVCFYLFLFCLSFSDGNEL